MYKRPQITRGDMMYEPGSSPPCILCGSPSTSHIHSDDTRLKRFRDYHECGVCRLIFVPPDQRLSPEEEFQRYELHENDPDDPRYRKFLSGMYHAMIQRIGPGSRGLDFGSGPGPALSVMLEEAGHTVSLYDIFYDKNEAVFNCEYDFITTTETAEHLFNPLEELDRLYSCLKKGGWMGIMTQLVDHAESFGEWHYKNDDTHVAFFSKYTFEWLQVRWNADLEFAGKDIMLFRK